MPFILLLIAAVFIVSAFQNTQADLAATLEQDAPGYLKWAAALAAVGALGWIPGMQKPSRYMLALVLLVILLKNYQQIFAGFEAAAGGATATASQPTPAADYISSNGGAVPVSSINPVSTVGATSLAATPTSYLIGSTGNLTGLTGNTGDTVALLGTGGSAATSGYEMTSSGALVPVETTGNVNAYSTTAGTTYTLPFGSFSPTLFGGSELDAGFGGTMETVA